MTITSLIYTIEYLVIYQRVVNERIYQPRQQLQQRQQRLQHQPLQSREFDSGTVEDVENPHERKILKGIPPASENELLEHVHVKIAAVRPPALAESHSNMIGSDSRSRNLTKPTTSSLSNNEKNSNQVHEHSFHTKVCITSKTHTPPVSQLIVCENMDSIKRLFLVLHRLIKDTTWDISLIFGTSTDWYGCQISSAN